MSEQAAPARVRQTAAPQPGLKNDLRLQRKCACGKHTVDGSECSACKAKRMSLQRWSADRPSPASMLRAGAPQPRQLGPAEKAEQRERDFIRLDVREDAAEGGRGEIQWLTSVLADTVAGIDAPGLFDRSSSARPGRAKLRDTYLIESPGSTATAGSLATRGHVEGAADPERAIDLAPAASTSPTSIAAEAASAETTAATALAPSATASPASTSAAATASAPIAAPARPVSRPAAAAEPGEPQPDVEEPQLEEDALTAALPQRHLLFDDRAEDLNPGQMERTVFLDRLQAEVARAAEEELAGTGRTTDGCPYLRYWFGYYRSRSSRQIERALHRYAPETVRAERAADYIPLVVERVRRAVATWARTGEITGIPTDLAAGAALARSRKDGIRTTRPFGPILRKAREDRGSRGADDPERVQAELGDGRPLDAGVRSRMEEALGRELGPVHLHTDAGAGRLANSLNARAFAVGGHVAFAAGEYRPGTLAGDALIAHELAHVVQQSGGGRRTASAEPASYGALERDADRAAVGAVASLWGAARTTAASAGPALRSGLRLSRCSPRCPTKIEVTQLHPVRLTADHVRANWRTGWGAVAEMKVSDAKGSNFDGTSIHENLSPGTNTCGSTPNCTNTHGSGGASGTTFKVGTDIGPTASGAYASCGPPLLVNSLVFPAKRNTFYDCHLAGFGNSKLHQFGLASCTQSCTQYYDCHGTRIVDKTFTITRQFTRGVINGVGVTNIALTKQ